MTNVNPYSPPSIAEEVKPWWSRLTHSLFASLFSPANRTEPNFANGDALIIGGIAYFIDPADETTLYAGSPSSDRSDSRFALIAQEAIRYLPEFLDTPVDPTLSVEQRRLVVRIVNGYNGIFADYVRAVEVLPAPLSRSLAASIQDRRRFS